MSNDVTINVKATDNASTSMATIGKNSESMATKVGGAISKLGGQIGGEVGELVDKVGAGFETIGKSSSAGWGKVAAGGAVVAGVGVAMQAFASKGQQAEAQLKVAVDNTGVSFDEYAGKVSKAESAGAKYGDTNAQVAAALQIEVQATGDINTALSDLTVTYNLAAAKHISLADAASLVAKVYSGSSKTLKQYGIDMKVTAGNTQEATAALDALNAKISGQADASVDNFGGKVNQAKAVVTDWADKVAAFAGGPLTYLGTAVGVVSGVVDIWSARSTRAAIAQEELAVANAQEGEAAAASVAGNSAAAASEDVLAASAERAGAAQGASKLSMLGGVGALAVFTYAAYEGGNALSGLIEKNNSFAKVMDTSKKTMEAFTAAVQADGGAVGVQSQKTAGAALQASGLADKAAKAGIGLAQLTGGVTGGADAFNQLVGAWKAGGKPSDDTLVALKLMAGEFSDAASSTSDLTGAVSELGTQVTPTAQSLIGMADAFTAVLPPVLSVDDAIKQLLGSTEDLNRTQDTLQLGINDLSKTIQGNGRALTGNTTGAIQNRQAIEDQIDTINQVAQKQLDAGVATDTVTGTMKTNEAQLVKSAKQAGLNAQQTQALIDKYALVPQEVATTIQLNDEAARTELSSYLSLLANAASMGLGSTLRSQVPTYGGGSLSHTVKASGGIVGAATGGIRSGLTWVGEHGPELAQLAPGTNVHSNPDSMRMASQGGGGSGWNGVVTLEIVGGDAELTAFLRKIVRVKGGGNVQKALGGG